MSQVSAPSGSPHNLALGFSRPRMAMIYLVMVALVFVIRFLRPGPNDQSRFGSGIEKMSGSRYLLGSVCNTHDIFSLRCKIIEMRRRGTRFLNQLFKEDL